MSVFWILISNAFQFPWYNPSDHDIFDSAFYPTSFSLKFNRHCYLRVWYALYSAFLSEYNVSVSKDSFDWTAIHL